MEMRLFECEGCECMMVVVVVPNDFCSSHTFILGDYRRQFIYLGK